MKKTIELYQEELKKLDIGIANIHKEIQQFRASVEKKEKDIQKLDRNRQKIVKKINELRTKDSCPLGTRDLAKLSKVNITDMYEWSKFNDPILTMTLENDNDVTKFYLNNDNVLFTLWVSPEEICGAIYHWNGKCLMNYCSYDGNFESHDESWESEWATKTKELFSKYTANLKANKAIERAINS